MACCIRYQHPSSTGATCQPSKCRQGSAGMRQLLKPAQEGTPPVQGLRGRWGSFEGRRHWLGLGDGAPPPSDGPPALRSSRLQQQGRLHPGGPALLAALHCSLAETLAAHLAPQAVCSHRAGESGCNSLGAADLGWLDLPPGQASLHLQRVQATWPPGCQLPAQATAGDGGLRSIPTTSGITLHCSAAPLQDSRTGARRRTTRCQMSPSVTGASAAASARLLRELLWSPARGPLCCGASTGWEAPAPKPVRRQASPLDLGHCQPGKLPLAAAASLIAAGTCLARHGMHCQQ